MRTTLTIEDDIAAQLNRVRAERKATLKQVVNDALRAGLATFKSDRRRTKFVTRAQSLGQCLTGDVDDVHGVLSLIEGDGRP